MEEKGAPATAAAASGEPGAAGMKVVVAVDASEESLNALSWALDNVIGRRADAVSVVVLHAQHGVDHFVYPVAAHGIGAIAYAPTSAIESMRKAQEEISRKVVSRALDVCKQRGERDGRHRGGRRQGGHLPSRGGDARRPARPGKPRSRQDQEGVLGQRQRLPRPSRVLPRPRREADQGA